MPSRTALNQPTSIFTITCLLTDELHVRILFEEPHKRAIQWGGPSLRQARKRPMSQKRITIRPLRLTDADDIHEIMHMPNVLWGTSVLPSRTIDAWRKSVEGWVTDERVHVFVAEVNGKVVGVMRLAGEGGRASHVADIAVAVHDASQGQGIGNMLMLTVIDLADNWLNLVRLEVNVYTDNERAIRLCEHFDFEIEGKKRCN